MKAEIVAMTADAIDHAAEKLKALEKAMTKGRA